MISCSIPLDQGCSNGARFNNVKISKGRLCLLSYFRTIEKSHTNALLYNNFIYSAITIVFRSNGHSGGTRSLQNNSAFLSHLESQITQVVRNIFSLSLILLTQKLPLQKIIIQANESGDTEIWTAVHTQVWFESSG